MNNAGTADVVIVGGGVVGNAAAYYLAKKGQAVILLERHEIGDGGSSRNGGGVRQSARDPKELPLAMYGVEHLWPTLSEELGVDTEYMKAGNIKFAKTQKHWDYYEGVIASNRAGGLEIEMLDQKQTRELCPYVADDVIGSCYCRSDGHANPLTTTLGFYKRGRELGVRHITGDTAVKVMTDKGRAIGIETAGGNRYYADKIILASGYETRELTDPLGIDIPMRKKLIECMVIEMQPEMVPMMMTLPEEHTWGYGHQTKHGSFVFGGSGFIDNFLRPDEGRTTQMTTIPRVARWLAEYIPVLENAKVLRSWSGFEDITPDSCCVISNVDEVPGLILGCGFSGHGFGISPVAGLLLSELACGEQTSIEISQLHYDRFVV